MKSKRYIPVISVIVLLLSATESLACSFTPYYPGEYLMFRVYDAGANVTAIDKATSVCESWRRMVGSWVSIESIYEVVYKYSLEDLEAARDNRNFKNEFVERMRSNKDIYDYLHIAKMSERIRALQNDKWYYPCKEDGVSGTLEDLLDEINGTLMIKSDDKNFGLADRYVLQGLRILYALGRFEDINAYWESNSHYMKGDIIETMCKGYAVGAWCRTGRINEAMKYFLDESDFESLEYCKRLSGKYSRYGNLEVIAEYDPDSPQTARFLQEQISRLESYHNGSNLKSLYDIIISASARCRAENRSQWLYGAAFIKDMDGSPTEALKLLKQAEKCPNSDFLSSSLRVFRIYLEAKTLNYDRAYEKRLLEELEWLDGKISANLSPEISKQVADIYRIKNNISFYYWNDMLRKIVLGTIVPRMMECGKTGLALRLANMADNRIFQLTGAIDSDRKTANIYNAVDFSNEFFNLMDESVSTDDLSAYIGSIGKTGSELSRFLDKRSYRDEAYLNDILGTKLLREGKYHEAAAVFEKVPAAYQYKMNVNEYMNVDPFINGELRASLPYPEYKKSFAETMDGYENIITHSKDPDERGMAMVMKGLGMKSSHSFAWALTQYHKWSFGDTWEKAQYTKEALSEGERLIKTGLKMIREPELAAQICYHNLGLTKKVLDEYEETSAARLVRHYCDNLKDYHPARKQIPFAL